MNNNSNNSTVNNKSKKLKRTKGSRYLVPKLRFSNNVKEKYVPYNNEDNYTLPTNNMKTYRSRHRERIDVDRSNMNNYPPYVYNRNIEMQKNKRVNNHKKEIFDKLRAKGNLFLEGGVEGMYNPLIGKKLNTLYNKRSGLVEDLRENISKINPLVEKKLQDLEDRYASIVHNVFKNSDKINEKSKEKWHELGVIDYKIKQLAYNGARGLRNSTRKTMNKLNRELRH